MYLQFSNMLTTRSKQYAKVKEKYPNKHREVILFKTIKRKITNKFECHVVFFQNLFQTNLMKHNQRRI